MGIPAAYWRDLRDFIPHEAAKEIEAPLLVLQGERDYQVTMVDFGLWKKALTGKSNVTFKSYPALNHLFISGQGPSVPQEYKRPGHVDLQVVETLTAWLESL
jgi:hypothetical protein